jgi:WD40 repeat protein
MAQKNETLLLLTSLVVTAGLVGGGYWFLNTQGFPKGDWFQGDRPSSDPFERTETDVSARAIPVISLVALPDHSGVIVGHYRGSLIRYKPETKAFNSIGSVHAGRINALAITSGRLISGGGDGSIQVRDLQTAWQGRRDPIGEPLVAGARVLSLAATDDGLVAAGYSDGHIRVWDVLAGTLRYDIPAHGDQVSTLAFSPQDDRQLVSGSHDGTLKLWTIAPEIQTPEAVFEVGSKVTAVAVAADGDRLVSGDYDGNLRLWSLQTGEETFDVELLGHSFIIGDVAWGPDSLLASAGYDEKVKVWNLDTGQEIRSFDLSPEQAGFIFAIAFLDTDAGLSLAAAGYDGRVRFLPL